MNLKDYSGVTVFCEQRESEISKVSFELIGKGRDIADEIGVKVTAVVLGHGIDAKCDKLIHFGADEVIYVDDKALELYTTEAYTQALTAVLEETKPEIVLIGATSIGRDLGPRVSSRLNTGLTADCTRLEVGEEKELLMTRPAFGGNIMATIICPDHRPQMSTVRPGVMTMLEEDTSRIGSIRRVDVTFTDAISRVKILEVVKEEKEEVNIADATILVSGGRGVGSKTNFDTLHDVADMLGGTISASRAVIDSGWFDHSRQVGQTGTTVRPDVYMACGISGAIQHVAGMEESDYIIAINKDAEAPIFDIADFGIVGDVNKVLPHLIEELKTLIK
ncbi:electron transfer flavoprotein subunit alpha/FixB family protein [Acidaminobacter sp. JC074]|uniref:electron transfer flavoprotein subunit alpha/FixB family protein n=1 Tax=Acidaminobacter sp. JC074 TaxID=2530199 RepID=UPI001F1008EE|nr:electron transfer flavoprotein subunit alpha/FixB family protein [Acidaminobacter sp. JC074]MCH4888499.1 electron transfer flavoprotein subunit alpha/FixB family protein [Acidaminobacter sp. JC074]